MSQTLSPLHVTITEIFLFTVFRSAWSTMAVISVVVLWSETTITIWLWSQQPTVLMGNTLRYKHLSSCKTPAYIDHDIVFYIKY